MLAAIIVYTIISFQVIQKSIIDIAFACTIKIRYNKTFAHFFLEDVYIPKLFFIPFINPLSFVLVDFFNQFF